VRDPAGMDLGDFPDAPTTDLSPCLAARRCEGQRCLKGASAQTSGVSGPPGMAADLRRSESLQGAAKRESPLSAARSSVKTAQASPYIPVWAGVTPAWAQRRLEHAGVRWIRAGGLQPPADRGRDTEPSSPSAAYLASRVLLAAE